ncbi:hypothetical protein EMIHUDRAFT_436489, partial [Emiliania huxleyi CCMP1516]|uniref:Uncharacterized protein n=2 Tax=Emiliania huxleyi TaxID=2903 RepID=A0A0D3J000_EMIH1
TPPPSAADGGRESTRRGAPLRLSLRAAGRRPRRPLPSGDPTPRRSRARREWRRARDLCSRARRSQWHGIPGSKALNSELLLLLPPLRSPRQLGAAVLAAAAAAAASAAAAAAATAASRLASVTAALHLAAARPSDGAGSSLVGASRPRRRPPSRRRSARGRPIPCQSRRLPCQSPAPPPPPPRAFSGPLSLGILNRRTAY